MGQKFIEKEIDGESYIFTMLRPRISTKLLVKIIKIIGPSVGKAFNKEVKIKNILDINIDIGSAVMTLCERIDEDNVQNIIDTLFTQVQHKGKGILSNIQAYEELFSGRLKHLFNVVKASLEVQYADFFDGKEGLEEFLNVIQDKSQNQQDSQK